MGLILKHRKALKSLGQNFLIDNNIIQKIIDTSNIEKNDNILEIGPGRGALTEKIVSLSDNVVLVEYDHLLAKFLSEKFSNIKVLDRDILSVDLNELLEEKKWKVIANLPYNISTEVLFKLYNSRDNISSMILMLQKEVGQRLVAKPATSNYGVTTLLLGLWFDINLEFLVSANSFSPKPKVDSAILKFTPLEKARVDVGNETIFKKIVKSVFSTRRKTLLNSLKLSGIEFKEPVEDILAKLDIDGKRRGETLSMEEFAKISKYLAIYWTFQIGFSSGSVNI